MRGFIVFVIFAGFLEFLGADNVVILEDSHEYSPSLAEGARGWVDLSSQDSRFDSSLRGDFLKARSNPKK